MKKRIYILAAALLAITLVPAAGFAQQTDDEDGGGFEWSVSADVTSNYIWRGYEQGDTGKFFNFNVQPCVWLGYKGLYLELWNTTAFNGSYNEVDITLGYSIAGFDLSVSDYYFDYDCRYFRNYKASHSLNATLSYEFSFPLTLTWSTVLVADDYYESGRRAWSSYVEASYTHSFDRLFDVTATVGASPYTAPYWCLDREGEVLQGFNFTNLELGISREFEVGCATIPVSLKYIYNPAIHRNYGVVSVGVAFGN